MVFIDEIDALAPARGGPNADSSAGEMTGRLVSTLLLAMEEGVRPRIQGMSKRSTSIGTAVMRKLGPERHGQSCCISAVKAPLAHNRVQGYKTTGRVPHPLKCKPAKEEGSPDLLLDRG